MRRHFYIAAYDIRHPKRLLLLLRILKGYASGRQKSVFECFLTPLEKQSLLYEIEEVIRTDLSDRFMLLQMGIGDDYRTLGRGVIARDADYFYIG